MNAKNRIRREEVVEEERLSAIDRGLIESGVAGSGIREANKDGRVSTSCVEDLLATTLV